jgi:RNA polymerase sigma factor for flagellar operon FliA
MKSAQSSYRDTCNDQDELVLRELPQVYYVAARISERLPRHVEMQDLVQAGIVGLLEACRKYDPSKDTQFNTFAKFRIRGAILDSLREQDWGSRSVRRKSREIDAATRRLESVLGRHPTDEEIAKEANMSLPKLHSVLAELSGLFLVGQQTDQRADKGFTDLIESAPASSTENPFELYAAAEQREQLAEAISELPEREQLILSLYYREEMTMKEIAEVIGIAVSRVSQLHSQVLAKLRGSLGSLKKDRAPRGVETRPNGIKAEAKSRRSYECIA